MVDNKINILLIENNISDIRLIQKLLKNAEDFNHELYLAESLLEGLKFAEERQFDIVLLDLSLPDSSGFDTIIQTKEKIKNSPIIVLTRIHNGIMARKAIQVGVQDYLILDQIDSDILIRTIWHAIDRFKMLSTMRALALSLKNKELRFRKIIEKNTNGMIVIDINNKVRFLNPAAVKIIGVIESEIIGQEYDFLKYENPNSEIEIIRKDGSIVIVEIQSVDIEWNGHNSNLISLIDITERKKAKIARLESEKKYRDLYENSPYPILIMNMDGRVVDCNPALGKIIGYQKNELINRHYSKMIPRKYLYQFSEIYKSIIEGGIPDPIEIKTKTKARTKIWLKLSFSLINLVNETLAHILIQDISEIRQSEQEVRKLEQILHELNDLIENAPVAIVLIHETGKILRVNEEAELLFKFSEAELLNLKIFDLFHPKYAKVINQHFKKNIFDSLSPNKIETIIRTKEGINKDVEVTSTIIRIADSLIIQSFFSDITERKTFERNREALLDKLQTTLDIKSRFLAITAHELRTPLNAIIGFTDLLLENAYGELNETQNEYLNDVYSAGNHLLNLINNTLDFSKIEAGKFELNLKQFKIWKILDEINAVINPLYSKKGLKYIIEGIDKDKTLIADPLRFKQIIYNLLSNAIKFTEEGFIMFRGIEKIDYWEFQVKDTGKGIATEDFEVVFSEFGRVEDDKIKDVSGTGLGLSLTKRLVQLHGGDIWFESDLRKGTTFYFTIPKI